MTSTSRAGLVLAALIALAATGCGARPYREVHATNVYHHHLTGKEIVTHARYRR